MRPRGRELVTILLAVAVSLAGCAVSTDRTGGAEAAAAFQRGRAKIDQEDPGGAINDLTRAIELDPERAEAFKWRGHCFNLLGSYDEAIRDYDRAIELDPTDYWPHYARAMSKHNLRQWDEAIAGYTRAIELNPKFAKSWRWRGLTRKFTRAYADAATDLAHALELPHDDTWSAWEEMWTWMELAKARQALGQLRECERALQGALDVAPESADIWAQLGFLAAVENDTDLALERLTRAIALQDAAQLYIWTFALRALRGDDRAALATGLRTWSLDARIQDPWELQVVAFLLGESDDAGLIASARSEMEFRSQRGMPPDFLLAEAYFHVGLRHELRGELDLARAAYIEARAQQAPESWEWIWAGVRLHALEPAKKSE